MLALHNILGGVWAANPVGIQNYFPLVAAYLKGKSTYDSSSEFGNSGMEQRGDTVILKIAGVLTKHDQYCGIYGMNSVSALLKACYKDDEVKNVVIDMESHGGELFACNALREAIAVRTKPVVAFVNDYAFSAGYIGVSGCDLIIANSVHAEVGSIGVLTTIADYRESFKKQGINIVELYATQSNDKNGMVRRAIDGDTTLLQSYLDKVCAEQVIDVVKGNREAALRNEFEEIAGRADTLAAVEEWGTGKIFSATEAIKLGLVDAVMTMEQLLELL